MSNNHVKYGSFPLDKLVKSIIRDYGNVIIDKDIGELLKMHYQNKTICYVQFRSDEYALSVYNKPINIQPDQCILWEWSYWRNSAEAYISRKARSDRERDEKNILDENVRRVTKKMLLKYPVKREAALELAISLVLDKNLPALQAIGVNKLITTIKEI
jgi:hypothetical protein